MVVSSTTGASLPLEIERKFVVPHPPAMLAQAERVAIRQGYVVVSDDPPERMRLRRAGDRCLLTVKRGDGAVRVEVEDALTDTQFERFWPLTEGRRLSKTRYYVPLPGGLIAEVDLYHDALDGLCVAEVEFESEGAAAAFRPPPWMGADVTDDTRYSNYRLARTQQPPGVEAFETGRNAGEFSSDTPRPDLLSPAAMPTAPRQLDVALMPLAAALQRMTDVVDQQFTRAVRALLTSDTELAEQVAEGDKEVDALELKVDDLCERILARHQPVASDLRLLITAVKINTDLERIGDHCKNIARNTPHVMHAPEALAVARFEEMVAASRRMLQEVQEAFVDRESELARAVIRHDEEVNRLHHENFLSLVRFCEEHPEQAEAAAHLITASKALERISDHTKNIAESVVFLIEGTDIRHINLPEQAAQRAAERRAGVDLERDAGPEGEASQGDGVA